MSVHCLLLRLVFVVVHIVLSSFAIISMIERERERERERWLLYFRCVLAIVRLLVFCASSSRCCGLVYVIVSFSGHNYLLFNEVNLRSPAACLNSMVTMLMGPSLE